jgi:hypothetical protein
MHGVSELGIAQSFNFGLQFSALQFDFGKQDDRGSIENSLRGKLDNLFKHFHKHLDKRAEAVEKAVESTKPLVDQAVSITQGTFSLSIEMMTTDGQGNATMQSLVIEASVFRLEADTPDGTVVMDFSGAKIAMSQTEIQAGQAISHYERTAEFSTFDLFAGNNEQFIEVHQAIATLTETQVALEAYRGGDVGMLEQLVEDLENGPDNDDDDDD